MMVLAGSDGFWKYVVARPGPPGPEMPRIEGFGAPFPEDCVKARVLLVVEEDTVGFREAATRLRDAAVERARMEDVVVDADDSARPCRMAGARPFCNDAMVMVTGAASGERAGSRVVVE